MKMKSFVVALAALMMVACGDDDGGTDAAVMADAGDDGAVMTDAGDDGAVMTDAGDDAAADEDMAVEVDAGPFDCTMVDGMYTMTGAAENGAVCAAITSCTATRTDTTVEFDCGTVTLSCDPDANCACTGDVLMGANMVGTATVDFMAGTLAATVDIGSGENMCMFTMAL